MQIITGYTGESHVTSADDASLYRGIIGIDDYVLSAGSKFQASIIDNNTVRIMDGDLLIQGHQARIKENDYNEVTIDNGTPGQKRNDLIVARYIKNTETGIESITLEVVKGTPGTAAIDPEIIQEDLKVGGTQRDYPLYRVVLDGISLTNLTTLFNVVPTIASHLAESASDDVHGLKTVTSTLVSPLPPSVDRLTRTGNVVTIEFISTGATGTTGDNSLIGTLPSNFRPKENRNGYATFSSGGTKQFHRVVIQPDGKVRQIFTSAAVSDVEILCTYIL